MGTVETTVSWDSIAIRHERRNGLILEMARQNRPSPGNVNDDVLAKHGVGLVSDQQAMKELRKLGWTDKMIKRWFKKEAAAK